jgi:RNA polymerase sigma-70 factor (ECF subfamily)
LLVRLAFFGSRSQPGVAERALEARLGALMTAHFDFVWRSLRRLGLPTADADAGAQEVFVVASRKLRAILPPTEKRFLFAIALRVASKRRRGLKRGRADSRSRLGEGEAKSSPEQLAELLQARRDLDEILEPMKLEQRAVFVLYELEEMSVTEIAGLLALPLDTVGSRLSVAREEFDLSLRGLRARAQFPGAKA